MVASLTKVAGEPSILKYRQPLMSARQFLPASSGIGQRKAMRQLCLESQRSVHFSPVANQSFVVLLKLSTGTNHPRRRFVFCS